MLKKSGKRTNPANLICALAVILLLLSVLMNPNALLAKARGTVDGRVIDAKTGDYLPGANVILVGTTYGAASDRTGSFVIMNIPNGTYEMLVSYVGYDEYKTSITLSEEVDRVSILAELTVSNIELNEVVVEGLRQGQAKALNQQKIAENIVNVVDEEQMQLFPDVNSAEVLQRVPGVSIARDQGEGRYVLVRGTSAGMNSTSIDGVKIPSPEGGDRSVSLDLISADNLAGIEVTKAITPDMDGDAIGGAVNLKTKSALDYPGKVLSGTLGGGYNNLAGKGNYQGGLNYGNRFGKDKNIGLMLSGSFQRNNRASNNNEIDWGGVDDSTGEEIDWAMKTLELRDYAITRDRMTLSGNFDYLISEGNKLYFSGLYSNYKDVETRRAMVIDPSDNESEFYNTSTNISGVPFTSEIKDRTQTQILYNFIAGGENQFQKFNIDYRLSYGYAQEEEPDKLGYSFELDEEPEINLDLSDKNTPQWAIVGLNDGYEYDNANYEFDKLQADTTKTTNRDIGAQFNFTMPYSLAGYQATFKFGGKTIMKKKDRDEKIWEYSWEGDDDITMNMFNEKRREDIFGGDYPAPIAPDPDKVRDWFVENRESGLLEGELLYDDTYGGSYEASEDVYAYYAMTTINIGRLMMLGGFRHEITKIDYFGHEVIFDENGDYEQTIENENAATFSHILPMLHVRYKATDKTNIRVALTTGIARPDYETLVPFKLIYREDEEMEIGNPDLVPTTSVNFDLLGEHYLKNIGILSGGIFLKSLNKIIYPYVYDMPDDDPNYPEFEVSSWVQGDKASLFGFEIHWQQQLSFLPGFMKHFGIYGNYTYTTSSATVGERKDVPLAGQSTNIANFALSYEQAGFSGRLSMNYHGKYLSELGEEEDEDIYYDNHMQWDISVSQNLFKGVQLYVQAVNMTDAPLRYYMGNTNRPSQQEYYSWWTHFGLNYDF
ncbi:MAG: TonB-dependent receptor [Candidatus Marinimicrobia bacterium]|nr:TonB-dependent receptor [Candidatus Neomarinimicrobiota bacterium]